MKPIRSAAGWDRAVEFGFMLPSRGPLACPEIAARRGRLGDDLRYSDVLIPDHVVLPTRSSAPYPHHAPGEFPGAAHQDLEPLAVMGWRLARSR